MKIIVGLGNPGDKYTRTRHNVGFAIIDQLAKHLNLKWSLKKDWQAMTADGGGMILVKPTTFMNLSGEAVAKIAAYYGWTVGTDLGEELIVIHDDLDLPLGTYKYASGSSSAGHNGVQSIINQLCSKNFARYRVGIKTEELNKIRLGLFKTTPAKFVLERFAKTELVVLEKVSQEIVDAVCTG